jgi:hypothetical protein
MISFAARRRARVNSDRMLKRPQVILSSWIALLAIIGCNAARPPNDEAMRAALARAFGKEPPPSCRLLGLTGGATDESAAAWVVASDEPLRTGAEVRVAVQRKIPAAILVSFVRHVAGEDLKLDDALSASCTYTEWSRSNASIRMRQLNTGRGWIASIEVFPESSSRP